MSERKTKMRYDYDLLKKYCEENCVILTKDYSEENINRETIIEAKCLNCDDICSKNFRLIISVGCFCKKHTAEHRVEKVKATSLEKYGCENPLQNKEIKDKIKATNLEKYGFEHPQQNAEVSEKASKNAYKSYNYTFPSGRIERIQGYENYMLNDLLQKEDVQEDDIVVNRSDVPSVWYEDLNGKKRRYFVDCFIKSQNRCIEAKSTWTANKKQDCIYLKQHALKNAGYLCEIWIYDSNGEIVEKVI